jgi:hypothetical protein
MLKSTTDVCGDMQRYRRRLVGNDGPGSVTGRSSPAGGTGRGADQPEGVKP